MTENEKRAMSIDVKALAEALPRVPGFHRTQKPPELFAADLADEYARLVQAMSIDVEARKYLRHHPSCRSYMPTDGKCDCRYDEMVARLVPAEDEGRLREALRVVLSDYEDRPTEEYLTEAVRIFRAARNAKPAEDEGRPFIGRPWTPAEATRLRAAMPKPAEDEGRLRPEVAAFARDMEAKLTENAHKGHWWNEEDAYLMRRLREEATELERAIASGASVSDVRGEAADVANFALMLADNYTPDLAATPEPRT